MIPALHISIIVAAKRYSFESGSYSKIDDVYSTDIENGSNTVSIMQYMALRGLCGLTLVKNDSLSAMPLTQSLSRRIYLLVQGRGVH